MSAIERAGPVAPVAEWLGIADLAPNLGNHWFRELPWQNRYTGLHHQVHAIAYSVMMPILTKLDMLTFDRNVLTARSQREPYGECVTTLLQIYLYNQRLVVPHVGPMTCGKIDSLRRSLELHLDYQIKSLHMRLMLKLLRIGNYAGLDPGFIHTEEGENVVQLTAESLRNEWVGFNLP